MISRGKDGVGSALFPRVSKEPGSEQGGRGGTPRLECSVASLLSSLFSFFAYFKIMLFDLLLLRFKCSL